MPRFMYCTVQSFWLVSNKMVNQADDNLVRLLFVCLFVCLFACLLVCLFVYSIFILLSRESDVDAICFGRIRTRLGVVHSRVFRLFLWLLSDEGGSWTFIMRLWSHGRLKNGTLTLSATLPTNALTKQAKYELTFIGD